MAKELTAKIKLQCPAGQATPAPPVGPALGAHGVNIGAFVKEFNDKTRDQMGLIIPVEITVYKDRSFDFIMKSPPASVLLIKAAKLEKGGGNVGHEDPVGKVTKAQVRETTPRASSRGPRAPPASKSSTTRSRVPHQRHEPSKAMRKRSKRYEEASKRI